MTSLAVLACLAAACQTRPPPPDEGEERARNAPVQNLAPPAERAKPATPAKPVPAARPGQPAPAKSAPARPASPALPPALPLQSVGSFAPASWLTGAERALGFRVRGKPFVVAAGAGWLRVHTPSGDVVAEAQGRGAAQVLTQLPSENWTDRGAGRETDVRFALGRGISREDRSAPMSVTLYRFDGTELKSESVPMPPTTRTQVVAIAQPSATGPLWMLAFESKYQALLLAAERGPNGSYALGAHKERIRVPLGLALGDPDGDGQTDVFIARPYGDGPDEPGDVYRWQQGVPREFLPTTRGARGVTVVGESVVVADGWHKDYGRRANALVTRIVKRDGAWQATPLVHVAGRHGFDRLYAGHIDGDDALDLVVAGNGPAVLISGLEPVRDRVSTLGDAEARDVSIAPLSDAGAKGRRLDVIIVGPNPGIWRLDD